MTSSVEVSKDASERLPQILHGVFSLGSGGRSLVSFGGLFLVVLVDVAVVVLLVVVVVLQSPLALVLPAAAGAAQRAHRAGFGR